ncbi:MAG: hypothetical protein AAF799_20495 [Myxococcota bacterium]
MKAVCARCFRPVSVADDRLEEATAGRRMTTVYCSDTFAFPAIVLRGVELNCSYCGVGQAFAVDDDDAPRLRRTFEAEPDED